jgi:hypothetical protein
MKPKRHRPEQATGGARRAQFTSDREFFFHNSQRESQPDGTVHAQVITRQ